MQDKIVPNLFLVSSYLGYIEGTLCSLLNPKFSGKLVLSEMLHVRGQSKAGLFYYLKIIYGGGDMN